MTGPDTWASLCPFHSPFLFVLNIPPWRLLSPVSAHLLYQWLQLRLWEAMKALITFADIRGDLILLRGPSPCFSSSSPICVLSCLSSHVPRPLLHPLFLASPIFLLTLPFFFSSCALAFNTLQSETGAKRTHRLLAHPSSSSSSFPLPRPGVAPFLARPFTVGLSHLHLPSNHPGCGYSKPLSTFSQTPTSRPSSQALAPFVSQ